jgi:hypothetical protein
MTATKGQGGAMWGWVSAGAGAALVIVGGALFGLYMSGALRWQSATTDPAATSEATKSAGTTSPGTTAPGGRFSGQWFMNIECRQNMLIVDFGQLSIEQRSAATATISYQSTAQPTPIKGEARIAGEQLSFDWDAGFGRSSLKGQLADPDTIKGDLKEFLSANSRECGFTAENLRKIQEICRQNPSRCATPPRR